MVLSTEVLLSVSGISKSFGGAKALNDVSVDFRAGEVHALLGENGAGKSTLVKVIAGVFTADAGEVTFPGGSESADVAMVFQETFSDPRVVRPGQYGSEHASELRSFGAQGKTAGADAVCAGFCGS